MFMTMTRNKLYFGCFLESEMVLCIFGPQGIEESGNSGMAEFENSTVSELGNSGIPELRIIGFAMEFLVLEF